MVDLISIHTPKTAGTLFFEVLKSVYGEEKIFRDYSGQAPQTHPRIDAMTDDIQVIHGHFCAQWYDDYFPSAKRITWLRHPIFRFISFYYFWMSLPYDEDAAPLRKYAQNNNLSLLELAEHPKMKNQMMFNFIGESSLKSYYFVGIQEFFEGDLLELGKALSWPQKVVQHFSQLTPNKNPNSRYLQYVNEILSDHCLVSRLVKALEPDCELYQSALEIRANRRNESKFMQQTLADWERSRFYLSQYQKSTSAALTFRATAEKIRQTYFRYRNVNRRNS
ncbi:MAG: sulfotransferase family 2 domain-containing protein [Thainema sp.]